MILSKYIRPLVAPMVTPITMSIAPLVVAGLISAGSSAVSAISKGVAARKQRKRADELEKQRREEGLWTSPSMKRAVESSRMGAYSSRSGDQGVAEANLRKQQANQQYMGRMSGGSSSRKLAHMAMTGGQFTDKMMGMMAQGRNEQRGRKLEYENKLMNQGLAEERGQRSYEGAVSSLRGAAMQNQHSMWEGLAGTASDVMGTMAKYNMLNGKGGGGNEGVGTMGGPNIPLTPKGPNITGGVQGSDWMSQYNKKKSPTSPYGGNTPGYARKFGG